MLRDGSFVTIRGPARQLRICTLESPARGSAYAVILDRIADSDVRKIDPCRMGMLLVDTRDCSSYDVAAILKIPRQRVTDCHPELCAARLFAGSCLWLASK
jgi:hypothetical protein